MLLNKVVFIVFNSFVLVVELSESFLITDTSTPSATLGPLSPSTATLGPLSPSSATIGPLSPSSATIGPLSPSTLGPFPSSSVTLVTLSPSTLGPLPPSKATTTIATTKDPLENEYFKRLIAEYKNRVDGNWSQWSPWSGFSATCDSGIMSRSRTCDNPTQTMLGMPCTGNPNEYKTCHLGNCKNETEKRKTPVVAFSVEDASTGINGTVTFDNVNVITGISFNKTTGILTCVYPGYYHISVSLYTQSYGTTISQCHIYHNNKTVAYINVTVAYISRQGQIGAGNSIILHLSAGDKVYIAGCAASRFSYISTFSAFLIKA